MTTTNAETLTARLARLREDRDGQAQTLAAIKAKVTASLTTEGSGSAADALLAEQGDAERKLAALEAAITHVLAALPAVKEAEAFAAAQRQVTALLAERAQCLDRGLPAAAERRSAAAGAVVRALEAEQDTAHRIAVIGSELDALRARFAELVIPKLKRPFQPPSAADLVQAIARVYDARRPLRPLVVASSASADDQQRRRDAWKALAAWLDRYAGSLSPETRAILNLAGVPDWELPEQRGRREELEQKRVAEERRFSGATAGEADRAQQRRAL